MFLREESTISFRLFLYGTLPSGIYREAARVAKASAFAFMTLRRGVFELLRIVRVAIMLFYGRKSVPFSSHSVTRVAV